MSRKSKIVFIILAILCLTSAVYAVDDLATVKSNGKIRFGVASDYIPFVYMEGTTLDGLDIALVKEMARRLNLEVEPIDFAFDGLIDAVNLGQVDLIGSAFSITDARRQRVDYTNPYYAGGGVMICRSSDPVTRETVQNAKIGVRKGTTFEQWVTSNMLMGGSVATNNIHTFSKIEDMVQALKDGSVDLVLMDEDVFRSEYGTDTSLLVLDDRIVNEKYAFAAAKGSTLVPELNRVMKEMYLDGTSQKIADTYFSKDFSDRIQPSITRPPQAVDPQQPVEEDMVISREITPADVQADFRANNAPNCVNGMQFVNDLSIPDRTVLLPDMNATKTWRIKNTGTCTWDSTYTFNYVKGTLTGQPSWSIQKMVGPGDTYDVSVDFTTPSANGEYLSYWQMRSPLGMNFGQTIWADYQVSGASGSTDQKVQSGTPMITKWYPQFYSTDEGKCPKIYYEVLNAYKVQFYIDNQYVNETTNLSGYTSLCPPRKNGTYTFAILAIGETNLSTAFQFVDRTNWPNLAAGKNAPEPHWSR